jgi:hypothetical protein
LLATSPQGGAGKKVVSPQIRRDAVLVMRVEVELSQQRTCGADGVHKGSLHLYLSQLYDYHFVVCRLERDIKGFSSLTIHLGIAPGLVTCNPNLNTKRKVRQHDLKLPL